MNGIGLFPDSKISSWEAILRVLEVALLSGFEFKIIYTGKSIFLIKLDFKSYIKLENNPHQLINENPEIIDVFLIIEDNKLDLEVNDFRNIPFDHYGLFCRDHYTLLIFITNYLKYTKAGYVVNDIRNARVNYPLLVKCLEERSAKYMDKATDETGDKFLLSEMDIDYGQLNVHIYHSSLRIL